MFKPKKSITRLMEFRRDCSDFLWLLPILFLKFVMAFCAGHSLYVLFAVKCNWSFKVI
jgi:hypothetical protein